VARNTGLDRLLIGYTELNKSGYRYQQAKLDPYEIHAPIGAGGMGEIYKRWCGGKLLPVVSPTGGTGSPVITFSWRHSARGSGQAATLATRRGAAASFDSFHRLAMPSPP